MFTGLVQTQGAVSKVEDDGAGGRRLTIREPGIAPLLALGESIAVDGACLTVVSSNAAEFQFQAGPETIAKTTLGHIASGTRVNLERALRVGDPIGGHFVTGHVDTIGHIASRIHSGEWETVRFSFDASFDDLLVHKGSIAVDGVSLTLIDVQRGTFSVMLIPHTIEHTTLGAKVPGDAVNLEFDLLAKHVRKLIRTMSITV